MRIKSKNKDKLMNILVSFKFMLYEGTLNTDLPDTRFEFVVDT
jgi:hypothetical protein